MARRWIRSRADVLRFVLGVAGTALLGGMLYLSERRLEHERFGAQARAPVGAEDWRASFEQRVDAITKQLEKGPLPMRPANVQPQGSGAVRWLRRHYEIELPRAAAERFRAAIELARAGDPAASAIVREIEGGLRGEIGIDGLLTHSIVVRWREDRRAGPARAAVVVDDLGNDMLVARELVSLDIPLTLAVMPYRPFSKQVAELGHLFGREVLLHLPMEPENGEDFGGEGVLRAAADREEILREIDAALQAVPYAVGVNNHMGSRFTQDRERMTWVLSRLKERGLFFLDSVTTPNSAVPQVAADVGLPYVARHVFLDDPPDEVVVEKRVAELLDHAYASGAAIGIGHPHSTTVAALRSLGSAARARGVEIVPLSNLVWDRSLQAAR